MKTALTLSAFVLTLGLGTFASDTYSKTDNTKMNQKTTKNGEITSQDQGTSPTDMKLTQNIRQDVMKQDTFSTNAKNVKIVSLNGNVILMGPVKTMEEKQKIESIAKQYLGGGKIFNEITVTH